MTDEELLLHQLKNPPTMSMALNKDHLYRMMADCMKDAAVVIEQLEAARADAKEAEAYADELAGDQVDLCRQLIAAEDKLAECEARLGKAVELLIVCRDMFDEVAHPSDPLSKMLNDTLAEIESSEAAPPYGLEGEKT